MSRSGPSWWARGGFKCVGCGGTEYDRGYYDGFGTPPDYYCTRCGLVQGAATAARRGQWVDGGVAVWEVKYAYPIKGETEEEVIIDLSWLAEHVSADIVERVVSQIVAAHG